MYVSWGTKAQSNYWDMQLMSEQAQPLASAPHSKTPTKHTLDNAALDHCSWTFSAHPSLSGMENPQINAPYFQMVLENK